MGVFASGLSFKTAPLVLREQFSLALAKQGDPLNLLRELAMVREAAFLATCNRLEFYGVSQVPCDILKWLFKRLDLPGQHFLEHCYTYHDSQAVKHLLHVATGVDSLVLGEAQILGQLKKAVAQARHTGALGNELTRLFNYVFRVTKEVRQNSALGIKPLSTASIGVHLAKQVFAHFKELHVLLIGASDINRLAMQHFQEQGVVNFTIANRTLSKAQAFAQTVRGKAIALTQISEFFAQADIIICAVDTNFPLITAPLVKHALQGSKHRPRLIIDLAVPRNVSVEVGDGEDIYLYTIDDLNQVAQSHLVQKQTCVDHAKQLIVGYTDHYLREMQALNAVNTVKALRDKALRISELECQKAQKLLALGKDPTEVVQLLSHRLTRKILHAPSHHLKRAGYHGETEKIALASELFELIDKKL